MPQTLALKSMFRLTILLVPIFLNTSAPTSFADEPDVKTCLPWTDGVGIKIGMERKPFEELRPDAKFTSVDEYPADLKETVTGTYTEGDPMQSYQPFWLFFVTRDKLSAIAWGVASKAPKDKRIVQELTKIRAGLIEAHGEPTADHGLRISGNSLSKIRREVFRPKESDTAIILTATSSANGSDVSVSINPFSEVSRLSYDTMVETIDVSKFTENESGASVVDLLEPVKLPASHKPE